MTHSLVVQAGNLIQSGDIVRAEALLTALVETDGDHALIEVLDEMPSKDLLAVIREYDSSKQSLLSLLITPEQFARVVVLDRLYKDVSNEHLRGMMNSIIFREDADANEFIAAIAELEFGYETFADYLADRAEEVVGETFAALELEDLTRAEISDHDWKELTWLLLHEHSDVYAIVRALLKTRMEEYHQGKVQDKVTAEMISATGDVEFVSLSDAQEKEPKDKDDEDDDSAI
jgi:hypothetical protein